MPVDTYAVTIHGKTPLIMHAYNVDWADTMTAWKDAPENKTKSKAGDDRSPAFRWLGCLHHDDEHVVIPNDMLASCFMAGGALIPVPAGRSGKTFKAQTQSGMRVGEAVWPLLIHDIPLRYAPFAALHEEANFQSHRDCVAAHGFQLFIKPGKVGQSTHIRVRPRFDHWSARGTVLVWDEQITEEILTQILWYAGTYKGIGDWRPSSKKPGPYGTFTAEVVKQKPLMP